MQHIKTKYVGPTTHRPARIIGQTSEGKARIVQSRRQYMSANQQHAEVAYAVARQMRKIAGDIGLASCWEGEYLGHEIDPNTWLWFFADDRATRITVSATGQ